MSKTCNDISIGEVTRQTGLSADIIHIWERKYGVVDPQRTHANRLVYSTADVHRLTLLSRATSAGHRIADVANLSLARLEKVAAGKRIGRRSRL